MLIFVLLGTGLPALAEGMTQAGNIMISMPVLTYEKASGDLYENDGDPQNVFLISFGRDFTASYFIIDSFNLGISTVYFSNKQGSNTRKTFAIAPSAEYYFNMDSFSPYAGISYSIVDSRKKDSDNNIKDFCRSFLFKAGISVPITEHFAGYGEFAYSTNSCKYTEDGDSDTNKGTISQIDIGLKAFF